MRSSSAFGSGLAGEASRPATTPASSASSSRTATSHARCPIGDRTGRHRGAERGPQASPRGPRARAATAPATSPRSSSSSAPNASRASAATAAGVPGGASGRAPSATARAGSVSRSSSWRPGSRASATSRCGLGAPLEHGAGLLEERRDGAGPCRGCVQASDLLVVREVAPAQQLVDTGGDGVERGERIGARSAVAGRPGTGGTRPRRRATPGRRGPHGASPTASAAMASRAARTSLVEGGQVTAAGRVGTGADLRQCVVPVAAAEPGPGDGFVLAQDVEVAIDQRSSLRRPVRQPPPCSPLVRSPAATPAAPTLTARPAGAADGAAVAESHRQVPSRARSARETRSARHDGSAANGTPATSRGPPRRAAAGTGPSSLPTPHASHDDADPPRRSGSRRPTGPCSLRAAPTRTDRSGSAPGAWARPPRTRHMPEHDHHPRRVRRDRRGDCPPRPPTRPPPTADTPAPDRVRVRSFVDVRRRTRRSPRRSPPRASWRPSRSRS